MSKCGADEGFADAGGSGDKDVQVPIDPTQVTHGAEHGRIQVSGGDVGVQILQASRLWQIGDAQPPAEAGIVAVGEFVLKQAGGDRLGF